MPLKNYTSLTILQQHCLCGIRQAVDRNAATYDFGKRWPLLNTATVRVTSEQARPRSGDIRFQLVFTSFQANVLTIDVMEAFHVCWHNDSSNFSASLLDVPYRRECALQYLCFSLAGIKWFDIVKSVPFVHQLFPVQL